MLLYHTSIKAYTTLSTACDFWVCTINAILAMLSYLILQLYLVLSISTILDVISILQIWIDVDYHLHKTFSDIVLHTGGINSLIILPHQLYISLPPQYMTIFYIMINFM